MTNLESGSLYFEMSKYDASVATFVLVHMLGVQSCDALGDADQRERIIPETISFEKIACFGLTEPDYGSDATSLKTYATKVDGGYLLNG